MCSIIRNGSKQVNMLFYRNWNSFTHKIKMQSNSPRFKWTQINSLLLTIIHFKSYFNRLNNNLFIYFNQMASKSAKCEQRGHLENISLIIFEYFFIDLLMISACEDWPKREKHNHSKILFGWDVFVVFGLSL